MVFAQAHAHEPAQPASVGYGLALVQELKVRCAAVAHVLRLEERVVHIIEDGGFLHLQHAVYGPVDHTLAFDDGVLAHHEAHPAQLPRAVFDVGVEARVVELPDYGLEVVRLVVSVYQFVPDEARRVCLVVALVGAIAPASAFCQRRSPVAP